MSTARRVTHGCLALICAAVFTLPAAGQARDHTKIKYPRLPDFKVQRPEIYDLDNGMRIFLIEDHELPLISVRSLIRSGSNHEPADKTGLGRIFGQVQREGGTSSMGGDEIDEFLEARAAFVETGMGGDVGSASMNCLTEDFVDVFAVFADVLRRPAFAEDKIDLARLQLNTAIARRNDSVRGIVRREFSRLIYGAESPLGRLNEYATVANVSRDDLLAWHAKYYRPNNIYLGIVGDFDSAEMKRAVQAEFGDWPQGPAFDSPQVPYNEDLKPGVYFIEKEDVTQANVRMGHLGILRRNPDYFAVAVMNEVLGGGFSGRLMKNVRSKKGLAYSVFGGVGSSYLRPGVFRAGLSTKSESMAEAVNALKAELVGIIENPPTAGEIEQAKETILNSFVFNYTSRAQILGQQMSFAYYDMPEDYLETYRNNIDKVTAGDVARVARKYIHPDRVVLLIVGKSAEFDESVSTFGEVINIDISIPPAADDPPAVEENGNSLGSATRTFERMALHMLNGTVERVDSYRVTYEMTLNMGPRFTSLSQTVSFVLPDKMRQVVTTPGSDNQIIVFNGEKGFISSRGMSQDIPKDRVEDGLRSMGRDLLVLASNLGNPDLEVVAADTEDVDGVSCEVVVVSFLGAESRLYVDGEGHVLKQTYTGKHPLQGTPGLMEVRYSNYGEVAGRMIPRLHIMSFEGRELASVTLADAQINPELDLSQFEIP